MKPLGSRLVAFCLVLAATGCEQGPSPQDFDSQPLVTPPAGGEPAPGPLDSWFTYEVHLEVDPGQAESVILPVSESPNIEGVVRIESGSASLRFVDSDHGKGLEVNFAPFEYQAVSGYQEASFSSRSECRPALDLGCCLVDTLGAT